MDALKIAIVQKGPVYFNILASLEKALHAIKEAALEGAGLIVFGETWLSGYPSWLDHCPGVALWNNVEVKEVFAAMHANSVDLLGNEMRQLCSAAKEFHVMICMGMNEKVFSGAHNGTLFNSFVFINEEGEIVNHHRKLIPTFSEKLLYGYGDAEGLRTVSSKWGNIGALICWEHWMPLSRQALHNENELIHIALWPAVHDMHQVASRHYAFEGRCFVIAAGQMMQVKDIPSPLTIPAHLKETPEQYLLNGGSCIIAPDGQFLLAPQFNIENILYYTINDLSTAIKEKMTLDVSGHYNRSDIFDLTVNRKRQK